MMDPLPPELHAMMGHIDSFEEELLVPERYEPQPQLLGSPDTLETFLPLSTKYVPPKIETGCFSAF